MELFDCIHFLVHYGTIQGLESSICADVYIVYVHVFICAYGYMCICAFVQVCSFLGVLWNCRAQKVRTIVIILGLESSRSARGA